MKIDRDEARRVASLAALEFSEAEIERIAHEMSKILDYVDQIANVSSESTGDESDSYSAPLRDDEARASGVDAIEPNAPETSHGHFVVPRVIGGE